MKRVSWLAWLRLLALRVQMWRRWPRFGSRRWIVRLMSEPTTPPDPAAPAAQSAPPAEAAPPPRQVTLYLVRHGQTSFNVEHRLPGHLPGIHLNDEGVRQARQLATAVREMPLTAIVSSPLERARETAEIVLRGRDVPLSFDPRLMDTDVARWAGQKIDDLNKSDPTWQQYARRPTVPPEGAEGFYQVTARVVAAAEDARHDPALGDFVMLVAHADVIKLIITHYLRLPVEGAHWLQVPNASITALSFTGERDPAVLALNWLPAPAWLRPTVPPQNESVASVQAPPADTPAGFQSAPEQN
jgi:broad specificity phosphatase PhoE